MVTVKLFAILRERARRDELTFDFPAGTVSDVLEQVSREYPALSGLLSPDRILISVNEEFVHKEASVRNGDEGALMPPFSGGAAVFVEVRGHGGRPPGNCG